MAKTICVSRASFEQVIETDDDPDLSWLGKYSSTDAPHAIDRQERGDRGRGELRYFIPTNIGEETGNPDSPEQDYQRMESYNRGDWCMTGIKASVTLQIPHGDGFISQTIESPGLWGVESDAGEDHLQEVFRDECSILASMLEAMSGIVVVD
jgi:hypothetical protein